MSWEWLDFTAGYLMGATAVGYWAQRQRLSDSNRYKRLAEYAGGGDAISDYYSKKLFELERQVHGRQRSLVFAREPIDGVSGCRSLFDGRGEDRPGDDSGPREL